MSKNHNQLGWGDRFALIQHYSPTDAAVCSAFGLTTDELSTARTLLSAGTFSISKTFDTEKYGNPFCASGGTSVSIDAVTDPVVTTSMTPSVAAKRKGSATVHTKPLSTDAPETASKKVKIPQKRGRKGTAIVSALTAIPQIPISVEEFRKQHNVSLAVLRQAKRFMSNLDETIVKDIGKVNVRQDKETKTLMIWREKI